MILIWKKMGSEQKYLFFCIKDTQANENEKFLMLFLFE